MYGYERHNKYQPPPIEFEEFEEEEPKYCFGEEVLTERELRERSRELTAAGFVDTYDPKGLPKGFQWAVQED